MFRRYLTSPFLLQHFHEPFSHFNWFDWRERGWHYRWWVQWWLQWQQFIWYLELTRHLLRHNTWQDANVSRQWRLWETEVIQRSKVGLSTSLYWSRWWFTRKQDRTSREHLPRLSTRCLIFISLVPRVSHLTGGDKIRDPGNEVLSDRNWHMGSRRTKNYCFH